MHKRNSRRFYDECATAKCAFETDSEGHKCSKMVFLGPPSGAKTALWGHLGELLCPLDLILESSDVPEGPLWAPGMNFGDFRVLAFTISGSILELWE